MKIIKIVAALGLGALVTACSSVPEVASRNASFTQLTPGFSESAEPRQGALAKDMRVSAINVSVPRSLSVSEANSYYPRADIVWRGDPIGDRHSQIQKIFENAFAEGTKPLQGQTDVVLDVEIVRFHSVSEKTRSSVGGVHNMEFNLTVRRADTGAVLQAPRRIEANLPAFGGKRAVEEERKGQTQKVRVTAYLSQVIRQELEKQDAGPAAPRFSLLGQAKF